MSGLPVLLEADGIEVLVVGAGPVAARRASAFVAAGARVRVIAPEVGEAVRLLAESGRVTVARRRYEAGDVGDAELVVAATSHRETNARVAADARAAHRLVNVADAAEEGSFAAMATHRAGGLVMGVSAGVPAAAARIRDALAARFDERYARAVDELGALRDRLLGSNAADGWRAISGDLLDRDFCASVEDGTFGARLAERIGS